MVTCTEFMCIPHLLYMTTTLRHYESKASDTFFMVKVIEVKGHMYIIYVLYFYLRHFSKSRSSTGSTPSVSLSATLLGYLKFV